MRRATKRLVFWGCKKCNQTNPPSNQKCAKCNEPRPTKYKAQRTVCGAGHKHASKKEAKVCDDLTLMAKGGVIHDLEQQPRFDLYAYGLGGFRFKVCQYVADFRYRDLDSWVVLDAKGVKTAMYRLKKKMMKACHGIEVQEA